jgi:serine/threonine protein kinase
MTGSSEDDEILVGDLIGTYRVIGGSDAPGVFRGVHELAESQVVLKIGFPGPSSILTDAPTVTHLHHPAIARLVGCGVHLDGRLWTATELAPGRPLAELLAEGALPARWVMSVVRDVAEVLTYAHGVGVVHRTLAPRNLIVGNDPARPITITGWMDARIDFRSLTPSVYTAPEVRLGEVGTSRADIYALGVIAYRALTGSYPNRSGANYHGVAPAFARLIRRMLALAPEDRPSAAQLEAVAIRELGSSEPRQRVHSIVDDQAVTRRGRRRCGKRAERCVVAGLGGLAPEAERSEDLRRTPAFALGEVVSGEIEEGPLAPELGQKLSAIDRTAATQASTSSAVLK